MIARTCRALDNDARRAIWAARYYGGGHHRTPAPAPAGTARVSGNSTARAPQAGSERPLSEAERYALLECRAAHIDALMPF